jgi:hypothetical protein
MVHTLPFQCGTDHSVKGRHWYGAVESSRSRVLSVRFSGREAVSVVIKSCSLVSKVDAQNERGSGMHSGMVGGAT